MRVGAQVIVTLALALLLMAQDCGRVVTIVQRFELPSCPGQTLALPDSAIGVPYRLVGVHAKTRRGDYGYALCPGFAVYHLREKRSERGYYRVRLSTRPSCTLDVAYTYLGSLRGTGRVEAEESRTTPWVEAVARLLMQDSAMAPRVPAARTFAFYSDSAFQSWCRTPEGSP